MNHGLLVGAAPPSQALLNEYLDATGVWRNDAVSIGDMPNGGGWRAIANRDMKLGETSGSRPLPFLQFSKLTPTTQYARSRSRRCSLSGLRTCVPRKVRRRRERPPTRS